MKKDWVHKLYLETVTSGSYVEPALLNNDLNITDDLDDEPIEETSTTGDVAGFETKFAFSKNKKGGANPKVYMRDGMTLAKEQTEFSKIASMLHLSEALYKDYKEDCSATPRKKVNESIRKINSHLFQIERIIHQNLKLKQESGITDEHYWDSTKANLRKINEKLGRVNNTIKRFYN